MTTLGPLQEALLELGLEDLIPLPEAMTNPDVRTAIGHDLAAEDLAVALIDLLHLGRISVWAAYWRDDPRRVEPHEATRLLNDYRRYSFEYEEAEGLERVYFVNVENIP